MDVYALKTFLQAVQCRGILLCLWAAAPGFGTYRVSRLGSVENKQRPGRLLRPANRDKYQSVTLCKGDGSRKGFQVHTLVVLSFLDNT